MSTENLARERERDDMTNRLYMYIPDIESLFVAKLIWVSPAGQYESQAHILQSAWMCMYINKNYNMYIVTNIFMSLQDKS